MFVSPKETETFVPSSLTCGTGSGYIAGLTSRLPCHGSSPPGQWHGLNADDRATSDIGLYYLRLKQMSWISGILIIFTSKSVGNIGVGNLIERRALDESLRVTLL